ncbi:hypothetical protein H5410_019635 [Solanum commersonii]|uniref:Uncharacterized protein n=1 Tax=Solanum commersonii TaxID=4109 RepID=A0A9J5Z6U4_SOLCO|nr:hypothetical protein H5410_019635 [Solanum commersonii]
MIYGDTRGSQMEEASLQHIQREANSVADLLADYGRTTKDPNMNINQLSVFDASLSFILKTLERDSTGTTSLRSIPFL